jgi:Tfp pilus assembly protein PilF
MTMLDEAISLYRAGRLSEARAAARGAVAGDGADVTGWSLLGYIERDIGDAAAAAASFDRALALRPDDPIALNGRARMALERAESDVLDRYAAAMAISPDEQQLLLEQTEARQAEGDESALDEFAAAVANRPQWLDGQVELGRRLWETRQDPGFTDHIRRLLAINPARGDLWFALISLLAETDHFEAAADATSDARHALDGADALTLLEAVHAGRAGDVARAGLLLDALPADLPGRAVHDAAHFIRLGELERASTSIDAALAEDGFSVQAWALAELVYRKRGDPRSAWLSCQQGLVATTDLALDPGRFEAIKALLHGLQRRGVQVVGQSVREGTQTRWRLFDRPEPELTELRHAIQAAIAAYVAGLPPADPGHPLLRHRDSPLTITGSWSVRLTGGGHHVSHIHQLGLISSACYFEVPGGASGQGCLEIGRPPDDLLLDLEPLHVIAPSSGRLALFPSYFHHGTSPFDAGERITVAFDVNLHPAPPI